MTNQKSLDYKNTAPILNLNITIITKVTDQILHSDSYLNNYQKGHGKQR